MTNVVSRTINGLRLVSIGDGSWRTEDDRYVVLKGYDGITQCDTDHPMRISRMMAQRAREHPHTAWAKPIVHALAQGKSGYLCEAGTEHENPDAWQVWDRKSMISSSFDSRYESFRDAAESLAQHLKEGEAMIVCDHCKAEVHRSTHGGWWEGADNTSECASNPEGHTVNGEQRG